MLISFIMVLNRRCTHERKTKCRARGTVNYRNPMVMKITNKGTAHNHKPEEREHRIVSISELFKKN